MPAGILPDSTPDIGSMVSHDGAPASEYVGAGLPLAVTWYLTTPALVSVVSVLADVICGATEAVVNVRMTEPSCDADSTLMVPVPVPE